ncbi:sensor histidine kinase [Roseitranquillus sediminis]|uniref:sensor histidine kinase n=1 Tax=Roseitranquillus sediminis TaxID=2809051 RepID=UPI001D0C8C3C|nr:HWE histidine kinase domain-containing protein [Roseitranquillus sediminis]MBM9593622.1 PAS domain S-box protein [Roseitranquillus sediminis]
MTAADRDSLPQLEELAAELLEDAPCGIAVTDPDGRFLIANRILCRWVGRCRDDLVEKARLGDLLTVPGRIFLEAHVAPMLRLQGFVREIAFQLVREDGGTRPVLLNAVVRRGADDRIERIDWTLFDATERAGYEASLREARSEAEELAAIVRCSPDGVIRVGPEGLVRRWNRGAERLLGLSADAARSRQIESVVRLSRAEGWFAEHARPDAVAGLQFAAALEDGTDLEVQVLPVNENGGLSDPDYSVVLRDVSARRSAERQLHLIMGELNHRVKNVLSVVLSIARQSLTGPEAAEFKARMHALSQAQDLLIGMDWRNIGLHDLMELTAAEAGGADRMSYRGPPLDLSPKRATNMALALHELATNALKYGALSVPEGRVLVTWEAVGEEGGRIRLSWIERGGPPARPPARRGFGTRMIEAVFAAEFEAEVRFDFEEQGLSCSFEFEAPVD